MQRGGCDFLTKAKHCSDAGAMGVVIVNGLSSAMVVMTGDRLEQSLVIVSASQHLFAVALGVCTD